MSKRFVAAMLSMGLFACVSFVGCANKPALRILDDRACLLGIVTENEAMILRIEHRGVLAGDLIITQQCMEDFTGDIVNEVFHLTR